MSVDVHPGHSCLSPSSRATFKIRCFTIPTFLEEFERFGIDCLGKELGRGVGGIVYQVGCKSEFALKTVSLDVAYNVQYESTFKREAETAMLMGERGIGPKVHHWCILDITPRVEGVADKMGFILADRMDLTIQDLCHQKPEVYQQYKATLQLRLREQLQSMTNLGYYDSDIHTSNVMVKLDPASDQVVGLRIVDFGRTLPLGSISPCFKLDYTDVVWLQE